MLGKAPPARKRLTLRHSVHSVQQLAYVRVVMSIRYALIMAIKCRNSSSTSPGDATVLATSSRRSSR